MAAGPAVRTKGPLPDLTHRGAWRLPNGCRTDPSGDQRKEKQPGQDAFVVRPVGGRSSMVPLDPIWNAARADLVIATESGDPDLFLWEHSVRVARSAQQIAALPVVRKQAPDESAVVAAALYHDAGWAVRWREGTAKRTEILVRPTPEPHREQGASMMEQSLAEVITADSLERASSAIRTINDYEIPTIEGQIVTEAENLEEFGLISLWTAVRRGMLDGKGVETVIETWRRRKEYRFWEAFLADSFRFDRVREIGKERLAKLERMMEELEEQQQGLDLQPAPEAKRRGRV